MQRAGIAASLVTFLILAGGLFIHTLAGVEQGDTYTALATCVTLPPPIIEAKAAVVLDIERERMIFEKNSNAQMPLASLTKAMTVLVASRILKEGDTVLITPEALIPEGNAGLYANEMWQTQDLIDFTLITSANDGAHALALGAAEKVKETELEFIARMNSLAGFIGLTQTFYLNDTGLDISSTTAGAYGSSRDMARFFTYLYQHEEQVFAHSSTPRASFTSLSGFTHNAKNTSELSGSVAGQAVSKTGFTDLSGGNLAIVAEPILGKPVAIVVLGSSREGRDRDVEALYNFAEESLKRATLCDS